MGKKIERRDIIKVLYNARYGGFGISLFAVLKLIKKNRSGICAYKPFIENTASNHKLVDPYRRVRIHDALDIGYWGDIIFTKYEVGEITDKNYFDENPNEVLSYDEVHDLFQKPDNLRFNKKLIKLVDKYGSERISGEACELAIADIPKGHNFRIVEHDGYETVEQFYYDDPYYYAYK